MCVCASREERRKGMNTSHICTHIWLMAGQLRVAAASQIQSIACNLKSTANLKIHSKSAAWLIIQLKCISGKIAVRLPMTFPHHPLCLQPRSGAADGEGGESPLSLSAAPLISNKHTTGYH